jgi:elongation factor G
MREYTTEYLRNVVFAGHQGSGKTTLVEAMVFNTGASTRMGKIEEKNTVSDWDEDEKDRGLSLSTSLIPIEFNDHKINILDAPGFSDFQGDLKSAIRVADSVVVVVDAVAGVEVGTELAWEYAKDYLHPMIVVINKIDRENASFERTLQSLKDRFPDYKFIPVMLPIGEQHDFKGVVNVLTQKAYYNEGAKREDLPAELVEATAAAHMALTEAAAESDTALMEKYFAENDLSFEEIRDGMRAAAKDHTLNTVPVFVTSGAKNIGTVPLMEALIVYVSPPSQRRVQVLHADGEREFLYAPQSDEGRLAAYVFKSLNDKFVGALSYVRVFSGAIRADARCWNAQRETEERFNSLMTVRGKEQMPLPVLHAGDIGVVAKLTVTKTGDTFSSKDDPITITAPAFPVPLYAVAVMPRTQADSTKMGVILTSLCEADPTLRWRQDPDTHQVVLEGMGEVHINVAVNRAHRLGVNVDTALPKVPYKETVLKRAETVYRHKKQTGGAGQFAEISLRVEPNVGKGFSYETQVIGGAISSSFLPSIEKGIVSVLGEGPLAGYPIVDVRAVVFDGKMHPVDSKDIAFQIAGREGFKQAMLEASPVLLEPIMDIRITVPEALMGDIMGDLNTRRGRVQGMDSNGPWSIINAQVPLSEVQRYGNDLRSMTGGRGYYTLSLSHYEHVPQHIAQAIVQNHKAEA